MFQKNYRRNMRQPIRNPKGINPITGQPKRANLKKFDVYFKKGKKFTLEAENIYVLPVRHDLVCVILPAGSKPLYWNWWRKRWQENQFVSWPRQFAKWLKKIGRN